MIERGHVVAWRTVKANEFPTQLQGDAIGARGTPPRTQQEIAWQKRFAATLISLIVSSEAAPSPWRDFGEQYFNAAFRHRRRGGT